ncbi:MAG: peptidylprolyl isomerase, partial [Candidatus Eremiobacteraeota bacterium]|nr:peptidylprolyl isomerase [Candidatus Eremiobacteraeota bacterium]
KTKASVSPGDGYGEYDPQLKFSIPRQNLGSEIPAVGTMVGLETPDGHRMMASIAEIGGDHVVLDANHPLAGQNLHFEVNVVSIRAAQPEELAHGHVHGPGGHHH